MAMDADELGRAIEAHGRTVFSIAQRIVRDPGVAEEVAQDVFLELYRCADRIGDGDHTKFWLRRVAVHRATDAVRRRGRQPEVDAEIWMERAHGAEPVEDGRRRCRAICGVKERKNRGRSAPASPSVEMTLWLWRGPSGLWREPRE